MELIQNFYKLNPHIRFGALGSLYGICLYYFVTLVATASAPKSIHTLKDLIGLAYGPSLYGLLHYKIAFVIILIITAVLTVRGAKHKEFYHLFRLLISNNIFSVFLFPGILIVFELLVTLVAFTFAIISIVLFDAIMDIQF